MSAPTSAGADREPRFKWFRKTRGGVALTREEVRYIKAERKKLKAQMKAAKVYNKYEFETTASSLGLYFDKRRGFLLLWWFGGGRWLWALLGAAALLLLALFAMTWVSQMRGYFTINLSDRLFRQGFVLSETEDFAQPSPNLFAEPAVDVPCISITSLQQDIDSYEGQHNGFGYFAYTCFIRNEGDAAVDYNWELQITGESLECSTAAWVLVIEDGALDLYAEPGTDGLPQTVPGRDDNSRGYLNVPVMDLASDPGKYLEPVKSVGGATYYRITTTPFADEYTVATGSQTDVDPMEIHKYTIVVWLEGDDPECTNDRIGGHLGLNLQFGLVEEEEAGKGSFWSRLWESLKFWD